MSVNRQTLEDLFLEAIESGDLEKVQACITLGVNVNFCDKDGISALYYAIHNKTVLDLLLSQPRVDVNIKSKFGGTALMKACDLGRLAAVMRLCQVQGIDLNTTDIDGDTAAMWAVLSDQHKIVDYLKTLPNVDWNVKDKFEDSAILIAVAEGNVDTLEALLTIPNIDINATDGNGRSIAHIAVEGENDSKSQCLELLAKDFRVDWNVKDANGDTPVMYAVKNKRNDVFKVLMKIPSIDLTGLNDIEMDKEFLMDFLQEVPQMIGNIQPPKCPVCYEKFTRGGQIFQCVAGHLVCHGCYHQIQSRQPTCPSCRGQMAGRAHDFEQFFSTLNI